MVTQGVMLLKEITMKTSFSYTDDDFRETVDAFTAGNIPLGQVRGRYIDGTP